MFEIISKFLFLVSGCLNGALSSLAAHELGTVCVKELCNRTGVAPGDISEVILGQVLTAGNHLYNYK